MAAMRIFLRSFCLVLSLISVVNPQAEGVESKRAKPPEFGEEQTSVFFEDARQHLVGERPTEKAEREQAKDQTDAKNQGDERWADLVEADTLTSEVKKIANRLNIALRRAGPFKSGGNVECRQDFSMLATLFRVIAEHEREPRWQSSAAAMHQLCYEAAQACREPTTESFKSAGEAHQVLADLLRGTTPPEVAATPPQLVEQTSLMQRMETAVETNISPALADKRTFRRNADTISHEAQLLAMLARVIQHPDYDFGEDEEFLSMAEDLRKASQAITKAVRQEDYEATRGATGRATQSCSACHEGYRG